MPVSADTANVATIIFFINAFSLWLIPIIARSDVGLVPIRMERHPDYRETPSSNADPLRSMVKGQKENGDQTVAVFQT